MKSVTMIVVMIVSLSVLAIPVSAQEKPAPGPFDISHAKCEAVQNWGCITTPDKNIKLEKFILALGLNGSLLLDSNDWDEDMLSTAIPVDRYFKIVPSGWLW